MSRLPIIGVTVCSMQRGLNAYHISGDNCVRALALAAPGLTAIVSSPSNRPLPSDILDGLGNTPITVTSFNIEPIHNSGSANKLSTARDSARPAFALQHLASTIACSRH